MLENLRRKSMTKTYHNPTHQVVLESCMGMPKQQKFREMSWFYVGYKYLKKYLVKLFYVCYVQII